MFPKLEGLKRTSLIALLCLTLAGMQAIKESPWHDHSQHVGDCVLCHVQLLDAAVPVVDQVPALPQGRAVLHAGVKHLVGAFHFSRYWSRAPPLFL